MANEHMDGATDDTNEEITEDNIQQLFTEDVPTEEAEEETEEAEETEETEEETEEEAEETEEESEESTPEVDPKTGNLIDPKTGEKLIPQSELNKIIGNARIKGREYEEHAKTLEQMTGMPMSKITEYIREQQVDKMEEEYGVPREQASRFIENEQKVGYLEEQLFNIYNRQQQSEATTRYNEDKSKHINNPLVKKYEQEIDAISQGGQQLGWEAAMNYVLGKKLVSGEVADQIRQSKPPSKVSKRSKVSPEGGQGGGAPAKSVPKELKALASEFGVPFEEIAKEYESIEKKRGL